MIVFVIGWFLAMTWALQRAGAAFGETAQALVRRGTIDDSKATLSLIRSAVVSGLSHPSPHGQRIEALTAQAWRLQSWRRNLLQICFADAGLWFALVVCGQFLNVGGFFVLSFGALLMIFGRRIRTVAATILMIGLFLWSAESVLRFSPFGAMEAGPWMIFLADNRPLAILGAVVLSTVIAFVTGFEFLALAIGVVGVASGIFSLNVAVAFVWGERLGLCLRLWWQSRGQTLSVRRMTAALAISSAIAILPALFLLGYLRDFVHVSMSDRLGLLQTYLWFTAVTLIPFAATVSAWGHWAAKRQPDDIMERASAPATWLGSALLGSAGLKSLLQGLRARRDELNQLRHGFNEAEWQKVPQPVRQASDRESAHVESEMTRVEAVLLSRWDFFGHQLR